MSVKQCKLVNILRVFIKITFIIIQWNFLQHEPHKKTRKELKQKFHIFRAILCGS
jgi:hypothetical protein